MRRKRCKTETRITVYHVFSRVVDRLFRFDEKTKDIFRDLIWKVAYFSGVEIITYTVMSNHFHILVRVQPTWTIVSEKDVIERVKHLYGAVKEQRLKNKLAHLREAGDLEEAEAILDSYRARMNDLSQFMKTLKLRMTIAFNASHDRDGTLWEGRFGSVLLEDTPNSELLRLVAAYIDLNPVRAKIIRNPAEYRWSGFGDASLSGPKRAIWAKKGLSGLYLDAPGRELQEYAKLLRARISRRVQAEHQDSQGIRTLTELHIRNDMLMRGWMIGRPAFIASVAGPHPTGGTTPCLLDQIGQILVAGRLTRRKRNA